MIVDDSRMIAWWEYAKYDIVMLKAKMVVDGEHWWTMVIHGMLMVIREYDIVKLRKETE